MRQNKSRRVLAQPCALLALSLSLGAALLGSFSAQPRHHLFGGHMAPQDSPSCGLWHLAALPSSAMLLWGCQLSSYPFTVLSPPACSCLLLPPANTAASSTALYERWYTPPSTQWPRGGTSNPASCCTACPLGMKATLASVTNKIAPPFQQNC